MTTALTAFLLGALLGLFARPFIDAYVLWRAAEVFRQPDDEHEEAVRQPPPANRRGP